MRERRWWCFIIGGLGPYLCVELGRIHEPSLTVPVAVALGPERSGEVHRVRLATFYSAWHRATRKVGLSDLHFHYLRHTGNTVAAATGTCARHRAEPATRLDVLRWCWHLQDSSCAPSPGLPCGGGGNVDVTLRAW